MSLSSGPSARYQAATAVHAATHHPRRLLGVGGREHVAPDTVTHHPFEDPPLNIPLRHDESTPGRFQRPQLAVPDQTVAPRVEMNLHVGSAHGAQAVGRIAAGQVEGLLGRRDENVQPPVENRDQ